MNLEVELKSVFGRIANSVDLVLQMVQDDFEKLSPYSIPFV